jgi:hypothetical protein
VTAAARADPEGAEEETVVVDAVDPAAAAEVATVRSDVTDPVSRTAARTALPAARLDLVAAITGSSGLRLDT